jgi:hypothetical protein
MINIWIPAGSSRDEYLSPTSVRFKSEINDAFRRKRHQKRHFDFSTEHLLSRMPQARVLRGARSH